MSNFKRVIMATGVAVLLGACSSKELVDYTDKQTYEVAKDVVDEHSSFLDNLINGIDQTQESSNEDLKTVKNEPFGQEAQEFLAQLVEGKEIQIKSDHRAGETDIYGRLLVHAFIGGKSVQYMLIAEGLAKVAYIYDDYEYTDLYKDAEELAKNNGLNIWSISGYADSEENVFNSNAVQKSLLDGASSSVDKVMKLFHDAKEILKQ